MSLEGGIRKVDKVINIWRNTENITKIHSFLKAKKISISELAEMGIPLGIIFFLAQIMYEQDEKKKQITFLAAIYFFKSFHILIELKCWKLMFMQLKIWNKATFHHISKWSNLSFSFNQILREVLRGFLTFILAYYKILVILNNFKII